MRTSEIYLEKLVKWKKIIDRFVLELFYQKILI